MSCIICLDDVENNLIEQTQSPDKKTLLVICKTCKCMACNTCMIQYVNEFKNTQCPVCRLTINIRPFVETPSSNQESSASPIPSQDLCKIYLLKIPAIISVYIVLCYLIGEELLKNQLHINSTSHYSFIFINIFVGMVVLNCCYLICCRCSRE